VLISGEIRTNIKLWLRWSFAVCYQAALHRAYWYVADSVCVTFMLWDNFVYWLGCHQWDICLAVCVIIDAVIAAGVHVFLRNWGDCGFAVSLKVLRSGQRSQGKRV